MSTPLGTTAPRDLGRTLPTGEIIGRYTSYLDAQKAVDYLADNKFAVQKVAIVGNDLKAVERVTGRLSYPRVALGSAATGAWFGLFVGLILSLFAGSESGITITSSIALGAIFWLLFGVITYAFQRGKRDFTSTSQVIATSYDVLVDPALVGEARTLLQQLPMQGQIQHPGVTPAGPTQGRQQAQQAPERPAQWNDPYSAQPPQPAHAPQQQPQQDPVTADDTAGPGTSGPRRGQFPDLPDGRPQYGVRVEDGPAADPAGRSGEPGERLSPGHGADEGTEGHGSSAAGRS
ncbi:general stress protein [Arthrobacter echini]|uniref:general stress protein n=1 Tax=Arthrobacter echini TaxID=1529066 RepID=UPI001B3B6529|nr:general stress protein [Arthrobacter echini]